MNKSVFRRRTCRLCNGNSLKRVLELTPTPVGDGYVSLDRLNDSQEVFPLDLFLCLNCGATQLLDVVSPTVLYGDYIYETSISLGLATMSFPPLRTAFFISKAITGCPELVLLPIMRIQAAALISLMELVIAPLPKA